MTAQGTEPPDVDEDATTRRLRYDLDDLRFENARLKASIAERQAEIEALSERLGVLQAQVSPLRRVTDLSLSLARRGPLRVLLRRR